MLPMMLEPNQGQKSATKLLNSCLIRNFYVLYLFSLFFLLALVSPSLHFHITHKNPPHPSQVTGDETKINLLLLFLHKTSAAFADDGG